MRISIIIVSFAVEGGPRSTPLGAACVAAALAADPGMAGGIVDVVERKEGEEPRALASRIAAAAPDAVGFSLYAWNLDALARTARELRVVLPGARTFAGGPEASARPEGVLAEGCFDLVVAGAGEGAAAEIVALARSGDVARERRVVRPSAAAGEGAPSPWLAGFARPRDGGALWELSRGCPFRCSFCFESKGDARVRAVPMDRLEREIGLFRELGVNQVFVLDPTFNANKGRLRETVALMVRKGSGMHFTLEVRAELLDRESAELFSRVHCSLQIGLQSSDPGVASASGRAFEARSFAKKLALLDERGVRFGLDLIYGLPGDTPAKFRSSLDFALERAPNHLDLFRLSVLPGTALHDGADEAGLARESAPPYRLLSSPTFSAAGLAAADRLANACGILYTGGRAVTWFMAVARAAGKRPSALISNFADFLEGSGRREGLTPGSSHAGIEEAQTSWIDGLFAGNDALRIAARDLVRASGAWTRAHADGGSCTVELSRDFGELLSMAPLDLVAYSRTAPVRRGRWRVEPGAAGPRARKD